MILFLMSGFFGGCAPVEAQETPLPQGVAAFRDASRTFETMRAWVRIDEQSFLWGGHGPPFGTELIVSVRADGVAVIDTAAQGTRYRWEGSAVTHDAAASSVSHPEYQPERHAPWEMKQYRYTLPLVQSAVAALRDPQTQWLSRGPAYYQWAVSSPLHAEIVPNYPMDGWHLFARMSSVGFVSQLSLERSREDVVFLDILRLEINPPLPSTWFDADSPEFDTSFPVFSGGQPDEPLDPGFYAPTERPPVADGGQAPPAPP